MLLYKKIVSILFVICISVSFLVFLPSTAIAEDAVYSEIQHLALLSTNDEEVIVTVCDVKLSAVCDYIAKNFELIEDREKDAKITDNAGKALKLEDIVKNGTKISLQGKTGELNFSIYVAGDVDFDGKITAADARHILRNSAGLEKFSEIQTISANLNPAGITAVDARIVLRVSASLQKFSWQTLISFESEVIKLTNEKRVANGLPPLKENGSLNYVAALKSIDMLENNYFSHESPTYGSPFEMLNEFNVKYKAAGENIAMGLETPEEVVDSWWNSPSLRANMLSEDFTEIGVGYSTQGAIWTQLFIGV